MNKINIALLKSNIEKAALYDLENNKVFGSAYCVIQGRDVIYKKCFGTMSVDNTERLPKTQYFVWHL